MFINQIKSGSIIGENNIKETSKRIKNRSKDIFEQNILHHIKSKSESNEGKLIFYGKLKEKYGKESYLNMKNVEYRNMISNIRISTHKLQIETGRYKNIEKEKRLCRVCNLNKVETEEHFLLECPTYKDHRKTFYEELKYIYKIDLEKYGVDAIKMIFSQNNVLILNKLGKFIKQCWIKRTIINK